MRSRGVLGRRHIEDVLDFNQQILCNFAPKNFPKLRGEYGLTGWTLTAMLESTPGERIWDETLQVNVA